MTSEHAMPDRHVFIKTKDPSRTNMDTMFLFHTSIILQLPKFNQDMLEASFHEAKLSSDVVTPTFSHPKGQILGY